MFSESGADVSASSSMEMTVEASARLIRLAGRDWSRGVSCRLESTAACQRRRGVSRQNYSATDSASSIGVEADWIRSAEVRGQALL
jgi:hypothetical protein